MFSMYDSRRRKRGRSSKSRTSANMKAAMYRRPKQNRFAVFSIIIVVVMLIGVMAIDGAGLIRKRTSNAKKIEELKAGIEAENERTEELKEYEKYTKTKKFAEETAKEKLGLVHDDEIIFKADENK